MDLVDRARLLLPEDELDWLDVFWPIGVTMAEIGTRDVGAMPGPWSNRGDSVADAGALGDGKGAVVEGRGPWRDSAEAG